MRVTITKKLRAIQCKIKKNLQVIVLGFKIGLTAAQFGTELNRAQYLSFYDLIRFFVSIVILTLMNL